MGAGASRKYIIDEIKAASPEDLNHACEDLSSQQKSRLIDVVSSARSQSRTADANGEEKNKVEIGAEVRRAELELHSSQLAPVEILKRSLPQPPPRKSDVETTRRFLSQDSSRLSGVSTKTRSLGRN